MSLDSLQKFTIELLRKQLIALICINSTIFYFLSPDSYAFFYPGISYGTSHHYSDDFDRKVSSSTRLTRMTAPIHNINPSHFNYYSFL